jgi:hypothetical protein
MRDKSAWRAERMRGEKLVAWWKLKGDWYDLDVGLQGEGCANTRYKL